MNFTKLSTRVALALLALSVASASAALTHRYSFTDPVAKGGTVKDLAGNVDAKLKGDATVANGKLILSNGGKNSIEPNLSYLEFSASLLPKGDSASLAIWFTAKDTGDYARLLDIADKQGTEGHAFIYVTPHTADGSARAAISATDTATKTAANGSTLDDGKPHLLLMVVDGKAKKLHLYVDGKEAAAAEDLGENTLQKVKAVHGWIGRSSFDNDTGLSGSVDEFRVYDIALTAAEADALFKAGADKLP